MKLQLKGVSFKVEVEAQKIKILINRNFDRYRL